METHRPTLSENSAPQFISDSLQPTQIGSARIRLPNEIVDLIIQECWLDWDSRHKVLRECSLVSRKWRAMVIPYLFREITINPNGHTTSAYAQFLLDTPLIASRIRSVHIRRAPFTVPELIPLLERLPGLRSLRLYVKNFRVRTGSSSTRPLRDFTLETLECDFSECIKRRFKRFDEILTLFSDIKTLKIEDTHPIHLEAFELAGQAVPAVSASAVGKAQVHELYYQAGPRVTTYVSPLLSSMDAVRNLTSLCYFVHGANMRNDFIQLSGFLAAVGPTLQKLKLVWDWLVEEDLASNRKTILEAAQRGLSLCTNLVEFELHGDIVDDDGTDAILDEKYEKVLREEWHLQAGFIASIPSSNLRHLSFSLAIEDCYYPDVVHSPLLSKIRDACNRFTQLEALCLGFCNNESRQEIWQCIFHEMREFERILCCHHNALASIDFGHCNKRACKRYLLGN